MLICRVADQWPKGFVYAGVCPNCDKKRGVERLLLVAYVTELDSEVPAYATQIACMKCVTRYLTLGSSA